MHVHVRRHRRAAAVAVRLARDALADHRGSRPGARIRDAGEGGQFRRAMAAAMASRSGQGCVALSRSEAPSARPASARTLRSRPGGAKTWKKRWARPSLLTSVPLASAKVAAGRTNSARSASAFVR